MRKIIFLGLILYTKLSSACCRRPSIIQIESRPDNTTYIFEVTKETSQAELRELILTHQSDILRYNRILRYKPEDYYIAAYYKSSGAKILTIRDSRKSIGFEIISALYKDDVFINVAPRPYCDPIETKAQPFPNLIEPK